MVCILKATLGTPAITNDNTTYFEVTSVVTDTTLAANGATTTQTVTVTAIKTPVSADETANISVTVNATPVVNS